MPLRLLFVGDMHLGRRPAHLPDDLAEWDVVDAQLTPAAAWRRVVHHATESGVDAVVLAGDVVEADNARFEALGALHDGVVRLCEAGIPVYAVAGNHDVEALPRLAASIEGFRLLGRGGRWESVTIERDGLPQARLLGWSFPAARHASSPLERDDFPRAKPDELPLLGVLHCDVGVANSPYAPVSPADLERAPCDAWLLGHIHKPSEFSGSRPIGYLGSLVGLDPTETGRHGPLRLTLRQGGKIEVEPLPLAPLRWEAIDVSVSDLDEATAIDGALKVAIEALHGRLAAERGETTAVGCRIRLTGATRGHRELRRLVDRGDLERLRLRLDGLLYFVDRVVDAARPAVDLEALAGEENPPALLAARLLALERDGANARLLIQQARSVLARVADQRQWSGAAPVRLSDDEVRRLLIDAGVRALEELVEQAREEPT